MLAPKSYERKFIPSFRHFHEKPAKKSVNQLIIGIEIMSI